MGTSAGRFKKAGCRLIAGLLAFFLAGTTQLAVTALAATENATQTDVQSQAENTSTTPDFLTMLSQQNEVPYLTKAMPLSLKDAQLQNGKITTQKLPVLGLQSGEDSQNESWNGQVVTLEEDGSITFQFAVEKDCLAQISLLYQAGTTAQRDSALSLKLDDTLPFTQAEEITLPRLWKDATAICQDSRGNDLIPAQEQVNALQRRLLQDNSLFTDQPFYLLLTKGTHTVTLKNVGEQVTLADITLTPKTVLDTDADHQAAAAAGSRPKDVCIVQQAEQSQYKSNQSIYPQYDRTSPATSPYDVSKIRRNVLGKNSWNMAGQWVSWEIDNVPLDGWYQITLKYQQNELIGLASHRTLLVNGQVPSQGFAQMSFPYDVSWQGMTPTDQSGQPLWIYLHKGTNQIALVASLADEAIFQQVSAGTTALSALYIRMVMICGTNPDTYRDYQLEKEIKDLKKTLYDVANTLEKAADSMDLTASEKDSGSSAQSSSLRQAVSQLRSMVKKPDTIPGRLSNFRDTISTLSNWLYTACAQPLSLDWIAVHSAGAKLPPVKATFWQNLRHQTASFLASFVEDYNAVGSTDTGNQEKAITVWANTGRDQIQLMWDMVRDDFTPATGISVNLSLVQTGFIEATLAGAGPDVAIGIARGQPVNLACRGVLYDISTFSDYGEIASRFSKTAQAPYEFNNGVYALPNTQSFYMMFYRTDIFSSLGLTVPDTWQDVTALIARLQKRNMTFGLPYTVISAAAAVDLGMGAKDLFSALLLQKDGSYYTADSKQVALDTAPAKEAFTQWCDLYTQYGFDLVYDFYTRFRYGEMPVGIATYEMYNTIQVAAPEIKGLWKMVPVPGTKQADGSVNRSVGGAGSAVVLFNKAKDVKSCWSFMKWWTGTRVQTKYGISVENILGPAGRYSTANLEAFSGLPWSKAEQAQLAVQRQWVREIPEIPGSYFVSRCLDNAFRSVLYDKKNANEMLEREVININREITRKRKELKLDTGQSK